MPWRGSGDARPAFGFPLPGARMPLLRRGRPLKRWRWVGCFAPELMLCAARAQVGPGRMSWWAVWEAGRSQLSVGGARFSRPVTFADGSLRVCGASTRINLSLDETAIEDVETVSPHGAGYAWTRKRAGVPMRGTVTIGSRRLDVSAYGVVDDSAGYHARHTTWRWCAGVGVLASGARAGWNLVTGLHDGAEASERTVWVDGGAHQVGPVAIAEDLTSVCFAEGGRLEFSAVATRSHRERLVLVSSRYEQPFGSFSGVLPGAGRLQAGWGVMERHEARW